MKHTLEPCVRLRKGVSVQSEMSGGEVGELPSEFLIALTFHRLIGMAENTGRKQNRRETIAITVRNQNLLKEPYSHCFSTKEQHAELVSNELFADDRGAETVPIPAQAIY